MLTTGAWSAHGRFCCKSLFALVIKIFFGCTRDFRVKMWGTSSPEDKLAGDLGNYEPDMKISRILLSDKTSRLHPRHVVPKPAQAYEPEVPVIEATSTGCRRSDFFTAEKLAAGNLGLLQQYRHWAAKPGCLLSRRVLGG